MYFEKIKHNLNESSLTNLERSTEDLFASAFCCQRREDLNVIFEFDKQLLFTYLNICDIDPYVLTQRDIFESTCSAYMHDFVEFCYGSIELNRLIELFNIRCRQCGLKSKQIPQGSVIGLISVVHKIVNSDNFIAYGASFATFELLSRICLFIPLPETFVASVCQQEYVQNLILR